MPNIGDVKGRNAIVYRGVIRIAQDSSRCKVALGDEVKRFSNGDIGEEPKKMSAEERLATRKRYRAR